MSDYLAVAGVSAVLKWTLINALSLENSPSSIMDTSKPGGGVSVGPPDLIQTGTGESAQLNLFMYYASLNPAFRNVCLPSVDSQGRTLSNPPLALNLHYLVSAYGQSEFDAEIMLGWAMQIFHENPMFSQSDINNVLTSIAPPLGGQLPPEVTLLVKTTLASQVESIKVTPEALSNEEISRLWMAFQTHYRTTTSYQVTVVLIQGTSTVKSNLPVQSRRVAVMSMQPPTVKQISPPNAVPNTMLSITGANFLGDVVTDTMVQFDDLSLVPAASVQDACVRVSVPATLQAGVRNLRIVRQVSFGEPTDPHPGFTSNPAQFLLLPTITTTPAIPASVAIGSTLTLGVSPPVGSEQQVALMVGDSSISLPARPPTAPNPASTLSFTIPADFPYSTPAVSMPLRVQVDGAQSALTLDKTVGSPTFGKFLPQIQITS